MWQHTNWTRAQELYNDIFPITSNALLPVTWFISFKMVKFHVFMKNIFIESLVFTCTQSHTPLILLNC
jgi:hypothetical protein